MTAHGSTGDAHATGPRHAEPASEQIACPIPGRDGLRRARRRPGRLGASTATGDPTIVFVPTWSIVHSRLWKAQIPDLARRHPRRHLRRPRQRSLGPPGRPSRLHDTEFARTANLAAVMDATGVPSGGRSSGCRWASGSAILLRRPTIPSASLGLRVRLSGRRRSAEPGRDRRHDRVRGPARRRRGLVEVQRPLLAARLAGLRSSASSSEASSPSRTRPSRSRTRVGWVLETDPETLGGHASAHRRRLDARDVRPAMCAVDPGPDAASSRARTTRLSHVTAGHRRSRRDPRRAARRAVEGGGHIATSAATRSASTCSSATSCARLERAP